jgi:hypothetical protein
MGKTAHFSVDTRLTRLLGETYRSSEAALKELVDNAWDADARHVWIMLPDPVTGESITVRDDGSGMTALEMRGEYLNIARDKRTRTGEKTPELKRKVKGRKGIGKFSGLTIAGRMEISSVSRGRRCTLTIDKDDLIQHQDDLELVPLPFNEEPATHNDKGTTVQLSRLDSRLNFPTSEKLREILIHEYGREDSFRVFVNNVALSVQDVPGPTTETKQILPSVGAVDVRFTIADGKRPPRSPGLIVRVDGKAVGRPYLFGLDEDESIPHKLAKRVYGEIDVSGLDDFVTADWGGFIENSKSFQELQNYVRGIVKDALTETHSRDMRIQQQRLQRQIDQRLQKLPEFRRKYAQDALNRILKKFYGESEERITVIAHVALDAMEHDAYWAVLDRIHEASHRDIGSFAESLEQFGLLEIASVGTQAIHRRAVLDFFDKLVDNEKTLEVDVHKALESNLWILGRNYALLSSNITLRRIIEEYCGSKYQGNRASKRPDLLLAQGYGETHLLIEFKRPSHSITRDDIAQAEKYRDDLAIKLSSTTKMEIMLMGKGRVATINSQNLPPDTKIFSYRNIISAARSEIDWLLGSLERSGMSA